MPKRKRGDKQYQKVKRPQLNLFTNSLEQSSPICIHCKQPGGCDMVYSGRFDGSMHQKCWEVCMDKWREEDAKHEKQTGS